MGSARPNRRRTSVAGASRLLGGALAFALACDFPEPEACVLACGPAGECPSAFECQPETLLCAPRGQRQPCTSTLIRPGGSAPSSDAGEPPPSGPPPSGPPKQPDDAGAGPGPDEPPSGALAIEASPGSPACSGAELELELGAIGGEEPYAWRLLEAPAGVRLSAASGSVIVLAGEPQAEGLVLVELVDGAGRRAVSEAVAIHQRPSIATSTLPALCAGGGYAAPLESEGGDVDTLVWSARLVTDDALSLQDVGLNVVGSTLSGVSAPQDLPSGKARLQLGLRDRWCEADDVELELALATLDSDVCPSISIGGQASARLVPACRGNRYTEKVHVEGGVPPFTWTELASPPGLYFDVDTGLIDGIPSDDGELALAVTDGDGRTVAAVYDVSVRDRCWLAYVAGGAPPARLVLVDPRLLARQPDNARRQFPDSGTAAVEDYRFSPDGRFIAYRSGATPDALGLELVRVVDGATAAVPLGEPAAEYAWSMDSTLLFLASGATERVLRAIDVSKLADGDGDLGDVLVLGARPIPMPSGPFVAFGDRELAFSTLDPDVPTRTRLVTTGLSGADVTLPRTRSELDFSASARCEGASAGVLVTDPETGGVSFFPRDGRPPATHLDVLASSSSTLLARADAGSLRLFDGASADAPPFGIPGCARLLARASASDRFACATSDSRLAFFELRPGGVASWTVPGEPGSGDLSGARRVFSRAGRWFASPDAGGLSVWSLESSGPRRAALVPSAAVEGPVSTLSFSPDERHLVIGGGNRLQMLELDGADAGLLELGSTALIDDGCGERASDGLEQWCGSDSGLSALRWSPSSDALAFRSVLGTLAVIDTSASGAGRIGPALAPDAECDEACSSSTSARFQP